MSANTSPQNYVKLHREGELVSDPLLVMDTWGHGSPFFTEKNVWKFYNWITKKLQTNLYAMYTPNDVYSSNVSVSEIPHFWMFKSLPGRVLFVLFNDDLETPKKETLGYIEKDVIPHLFGGKTGIVYRIFDIGTKSMKRPNIPLIDSKSVKNGYDFYTSLTIDFCNLPFIDSDKNEKRKIPEKEEKVEKKKKGEKKQ